MYLLLIYSARFWTFWLRTKSGFAFFHLHHEWSCPQNTQLYTFFVGSWCWLCLFLALPLILSPLQNVTVDVGKRLVLTCNTSGDPAAQVSWTKNEFGLPARTRLELGNSTLVIDNVQFADDGEYRCTAANRQGNVSSSAIVEVEGKVCHMSEFAWFMCFFRMRDTIRINLYGKKAEVTTPSLQSYELGWGVILCHVSASFNYEYLISQRITTSGSEDLIRWSWKDTQETWPSSAMDTGSRCLLWCGGRTGRKFRKLLHSRRRMRTKWCKCLKMWTLPCGMSPVACISAPAASPTTRAATTRAMCSMAWGLTILRRKALKSCVSARRHFHNITGWKYHL